ncbi:BMA-TAF-3, isoform m [Aphelenchoides bicaudatus]|nr:BMA-TAF-3, isoform m [Aphelenchoides bicaudatus]
MNQAMIAPVKTEDVKESEPIQNHEPIKSNITPPPTLEQAMPKLPAVEESLPTIQKPLTDANLVKTDESKKERRHKKEKKKKREKEESRKRKHEEISNSLPPTLELSVKQEAPDPSPVQPVIEPKKEPSPIQDPPSVVIQQPVDKPTTPPGPSAVRLKIRIGSTLSSDSMKSSPVEAHASKPPSAGITPPTLAKEQKDEAIVETPVVAVNSDEPPPKKHKKEKKHKRDKNREMHFETEEQKAEYERQRKERKEKKLREKEANGHSNNNNKASSSDQQPIRLNEQPKKDEVAPHAPLKFKFKNGLESRSSEDKNQKVNEIFSVIKEKQKENSDRPEKTESKDKSHKKKHKKDKKHKDKEPRPTSSHSLNDLTEKPKPKNTIKLLNQQPRPASQNSALPKLFDPTPFKPDIKKDKTPSSLKPLKPEKAANISTSSSTSSKSEKKEIGKKKHPKSDSKSNKDSDVVWVCPVCSVAYVDDSADMIGCDNCQNWFHFACVGMLQPPPENQDWFCMKCVEEKRKKAKIRKK